MREVVFQKVCSPALPKTRSCSRPRRSVLQALCRLSLGTPTRPALAGLFLPGVGCLHCSLGLLQSPFLLGAPLKGFSPHQVWAAVVVLAVERAAPESKEAHNVAPPLLWGVHDAVSCLRLWSGCLGVPLTNESLNILQLRQVLHLCKSAVPPSAASAWPAACSSSRVN